MRDQQLEAIRAACIRANPHISERSIGAVDEDTGTDMWVRDDTIRLADVLMLPDTSEMLNATDEENATVCFRFIRMWNLRKDDLTEQSDECVAFLYNLLK
jgi:hypothetical protein